jgi:preprotein translocase subunit SecD
VPYIKRKQSTKPEVISRIKSKFLTAISLTFLALSLTSCAFGDGPQSSSEEVIEFRQVLSVSSAESEIEAYGQKFRDIDCKNPPSGFEPPIDLIGCSSDEQQIYLLGVSELDGNSIERAKPSVGEFSWYVTIDFDDIGTKKFAEFTRRVTTLPTPNNQIAITSGNLVITAPVINEEISAGSAQITGDFSAREARDLSKAIKNRSAIPLFLRWRE